ncbi:MAG: hypothetical protein VB078_12530, partial [Clostridiaceae bacterium]|nr:hypothetical protein [Clostridiaceae bacterium]
VVTTPIDLTNKRPDDIQSHFGKVSKLSYTGGRGLSPSGSKYSYVNPAQALPTIISSGSGNANIEAIKSYFTDEQVIRSIAGMTGMDFDALVGGDYKLLIEPIAYITFQGVKVAMTATESALYDEQVGGLLRSKMVSLSHKNLPLAMFLEVADLGYPAWFGSRSSAASDSDIKSSLGLGVVRFKDMPTEPPEVSTYDYEYRVNTEVITSVTVSGGQSDPDNPVSVTFYIGGRSYRVSNVYYPSGDSQIAWVRWTTPTTPQTMTINVSVSGGGSTSQGVITAKIVDLDQNEPPNPVADDRNDSYTKPSVPSNAQVTSSSWGVWRPRWHAYWVWHSTGDDDGYWCDHGWWEFDFDRYHASLSASMSIKPDDKNPTASGKTMKSGYGINQTVTANVSTNQSSAVTGAQNAVTYFPEFQYKSFWRLLERSGSSYSPTFEFKKNEYSTYNRRTHFTPIWMSDGSYTPYTWLIDCWTPTGMLSMNLTDSVTISGNLWTDWHIAPQNPK